MPKRGQIAEKGALFIVDLFGINLSLLVAYWMRFESGVGVSRRFIPLAAYAMPATVISCYWVLLFLFFGMYRAWKFQSRFDEVIAIGKAVAFGVMVFFFLTLDAAHPLPKTRVVLLTYWIR
ncbi:unnamed protein product, partial [marine sediment metagenome]